MPKPAYWSTVKEHGSVGRCRLLKKVPQVGEPTPDVFKITVGQLPVTIGIDCVIAATQFVAVDVLYGRGNVLYLLGGEEIHDVVVTFVQVGAA
jgi:hypothetical protein